MEETESINQYMVLGRTGIEASWKLIGEAATDSPESAVEKVCFEDAQNSSHDVEDIIEHFKRHFADWRVVEIKSSTEYRRSEIDL
jgi:hypothetical protein